MSQLVRQSPLIHISGHLIEDQPVPNRAVSEVLDDVLVILLFLEISPDLPLDEMIPRI